MEELDLVDLFYMIRRKLWLIILLFVLGAGAAYYVTEYVQVPLYYTQAKLMLGKPGDYDTEAITYAEISMNRNLIKTYATIAKTDLVMVDVAEAMPFKISPGSLKGAISLSLVNETEVISVSTIGTDPSQMITIVNTFAEVFSVRIAEIMQIDNVKILELAKYVSPIGPSLKRNVVLAGSAGVALALFIIFLIEMFDHTMKTPEDVTKYLSLPILGVIPEHD